MVVDDNRDITEMVQTILEGTPCDYVTANSGRECLDLTKKETFDLILLDMAMPAVHRLCHSSHTDNLDFLHCCTNNCALLCFTEETTIIMKKKLEDGFTIQVGDSNLSVYNLNMTVANAPAAIPIQTY